MWEINIFIGNRFCGSNYKLTEPNYLNIAESALDWEFNQQQICMQMEDGSRAAS
jgi:hypothetical protein